MRYILPLFLLAPSVALAHPGHEHAGGFASGLAHPLYGVDHLIAMLTIGVLAALIGGAARWAVPGSFLAGMLVFGLIGVSGSESALVEHVIIASIIVLGVAMALALRPPLLVLAAFAAVFGAAHGYAHGAEGTGGIGYVAGFMLATAALHGAGFAAGAQIAARAAWLPRATGGVIALTGAVLAFV
ncbi:MAG: protein hupE [Rhodobacteraceae bacterium]|nr:MAG: protein hupE [Paracoccaceae bacterium]